LLITDPAFCCCAAQFPIEALDASMIRLAEHLAEPLPYATEEQRWLGEAEEPEKRTGLGRLAIDATAAFGESRVWGR
jgi:hypothetical protein